MIVTPVRARIFREKEDLVAFITEHIRAIPEKSVLVITSKIAALAEGRTADTKEKTRIIRAESDVAMRTKYVWLTFKNGGFLANAGVDESNARGKLVLLPSDSFAAAADIRRTLRKHLGIKKLGVLITDSRVLPMRAGVVGVALGYAGFRGLRDYRGKKDLFGRKFVFATANVADMLASAAVLVMGEGNEQRPLALIEGAPVEFTERVDRKELPISFEDDMYRPLFRTVPRKKKR